jgi:hypothetical protein
MSRWWLGILLLVLGLLVNQYGFMHDLIWDKHEGAIYLGLRSYTLIVAGLVSMIVGYVLVWRAAGP